MRHRWSVELSDAAHADFAAILEWTSEQFGERQADIYAEVLMSAADALVGGPALLGVRRRIVKGRRLFVLHAARKGNRARHVLVFRAENEPEAIITILRILHDSMDIARHLPEMPEDWN